MKKAPVVDEVAIRERVRKEEVDRSREIMAIGERHGMAEEAREFVKSGKSVELFREAVLASLEKRNEIAKVDQKADLGLSEREVKEFSFLRVIQAMQTGKRSLAGYEFELSDAVAKKVGKEARGIWVPMDVMSHRDLTVGTPSAGGYLKGTTHMSFIEVLRNKMIMRQLGAIIMDGLVGDIAIPSLETATVGYWITENSNITTEGAPTFGQASLSPKTVGAYVDLSRKLVNQSSPSVEQIIRNDLASVIAIAVDTAAISGSSASNQPTGILNTSSIGAVAGGTDGAAPTWAHIVELETDVSVANADVGNLAYLTNAKVRGKLKGVFKNATYGEIPVWENGPMSGVGMVNGYNAYVTNSVPSNLTKNSSGAVCSAIIFGNFADIILGFWGALDINIDTSTGGIAGITRLIAFQDCDVAVRHAGSFSAMQDALTT